MKSRLVVALAALLSLCAGLLAAAPADAAVYRSVYPAETRLAVNTDGDAVITVRCADRKKGCWGYVYFLDGIEKKYSYSLAKGQTKQIKVGLAPNSKWNPNNPGSEAQTYGSSGVKRVDSALLRVSERVPRTYNANYGVSVETRLPNQTIRGNLAPLVGSGVSLSDIDAWLITVVRGGNTNVKRKLAVDNAGNWETTAPMGANNSPVYSYRLQLKNKSTGASWFWRGTDGTFAGGSDDYQGGSVITADVRESYEVNARWGRLRGTIGSGPYQNRPNIDISVASPPNATPAVIQASPDLDFGRCMNSFAETRTDANGDFDVDFLPASSGVEGRYAIRAHSGADEVWTDATGARYATCSGTMKYAAFDKSNLIPVTGVGPTYQVPLRAPDSMLTVNISSVAGATANDRWITVRDVVPATRLLSAPVIAQGTDNTIALQPGTYWVETGRRTGCSSWIPTRYPDNNGIFKDEARSSEKWKVVKGKWGTATAYAHGYVAAYPPKGYAGWMYRNHCKTITGGTISQITVGANDAKTVTAAQPWGSIVYGKVKRGGGKTAKELLVTITNGSGTQVLRTDLTDGSGKFVVAGLAPGRYGIQINADSWRGNKQSFSGRKIITVGAGKKYNAGTFKFQQ